MRELASANFNEQTLRLVEDLIAFLRQEQMQVRLYTRGFLHAKCYLFYSGGGFAHFFPIAAIVGSSNFTRAGLQTNKELNLSHRANLTPEEISPEQLKGKIESSERKLLGQVGEAERLIAANHRQGKLSGERKKLILLTATPINNNVFDLYNQVNLFTGGDRSYFAAAGIGDLQKYFMAARRKNRQQESGIALFNLLEEVVIRRTRPFIKEAYPNATIKGEPIRWPERKLKTIRYNLETTYHGIYDRVVSRIEGLRLAPYRLETYKKQGVERDQFEEGREEALVGIFKSRYLKRFESSVDAFRISVRRALEFLETFESYILEGKVLDSSSFQKAMRYLSREDEEDDATPKSLSDQLDEQAEARLFIDTLPALDAARYDLKRLHNDVRRDVNAASQWRAVAGNPLIQRIEDNRFVITNLISCQPDTPRVVPVDREVDIFSLQEQVIASIVQSSVEQVAVEEAPKLLDPIQQTIATTLRGYIKTLRKAYERFLLDRNIEDLLSTVKTIHAATDTPSSANAQSDENAMKSPVKREDLKLICFDYVW